MISRGSENLIATIWRRKTNSLEYEDTPSFSFRCRIADSKDLEEYQNVSGLIQNESLMTLYASRVPKEIKLGDKILILGEEKIVKNIGYYMNESNQMHAYSLKLEEIYKRCPKGIKVQ